MDLFSGLNGGKEKEKEKEPLAARMRPTSLDNFFGQEHIVGPGRLLRRAIKADQISSLIFYGPPGTGKTTLAKIIAGTTDAYFLAINAVLAGIKDLRNAIKEAKEKWDLYQQRTILFVDEVHRWNKAQQDALLPWVENGTVILIGATTENPYFEVINPLVSRSRIFQLKSLTNDDLYQIVDRAVNDAKNGYGKLIVEIEKDALDHIINIANGDARSLLNALELAIETTEPDKNDKIIINLEVAEQSIQHRAILYDKEGDVHYDTVSAFIKSLRGSDPDASLYWMARMVYGGEEPHFIFRRMIIFASEDVGLADPNALQLVMSCSQAFDYVGMPEGRFHLAQAALYLATAPKSNSTMAFFDAINVVKKHTENEMPNHIRDNNRDSEGFGHGEGYLYPHAYKDHWVAQQYLPDSLQGKLFYTPSGQGYEQKIAIEVRRKREAQITTALENDIITHSEILTFTGHKLRGQKERWISRAISGMGELLIEMREKIFSQLNLQRHSLILNVNAGSGFLTWEALRHVPEGGVWAIVDDKKQAENIKNYASNLVEIERPVVHIASINGLSHSLDKKLRFEAIVGRNFLSKIDNKEEAVNSLLELLCEQGKISLAETLTKETQRLYNLIVFKKTQQKLLEKIKEAEELIYDDKANLRLNWDIYEIEKIFKQAGYPNVKIELTKRFTKFHISEERINQWFSNSANKSLLSYKEWLGKILNDKEINSYHKLFVNQLKNKIVDWSTTIAYILVSS